MRLIDRLTRRPAPPVAPGPPVGPEQDAVAVPVPAPPPTPVAIHGWTFPGYGIVFRVAVTATFGVAVASLLVGALAGLDSVLVLLILAVVFALGLDPLVRFLVHRGWRRNWAVAVVAAGVVVVLVGFVAAILPPIVTQTTQFFHSAPLFLQQIQDRHTRIGELMARYHVVDTVQRGLGSGGMDAVGGVLGVGAAVLGAVASTLTVGVLTVYFMANLPAVKGALWRTAPASRRRRVAELGERVFDQVGGYLLGNVFTSVVAGVGTWLYCLVVGVPYPLALGILVAVFDLIPVVGSTIGGAVVSLVALTVSVPIAVLTLAYYIAFRLLEDYLLIPRVMERTVNVPPLLTIVALLIGGALAGIVGAFLAIPVAAAVQLILREVVWPRLDAA
ncbi:MAG TPA: AI-2E family transporter [Mycobacteriales bacterium]